MTQNTTKPTKVRTYTTQHEVNLRGKELLEQLLMVTTGGSRFLDSEAGNEIFLELFQLFQLKFEGFYPRFLAEEMEYTLFDFTHSRDDAFREWKNGALTARGLDENGLPLDVEQPKEQVSATERQMEYVKEVAEKVALALESGDVSEGVKDCLKTIVFEMSNEANLPLADLTLIRAAFPNIMENLDWNYGKGYLHSIAAILAYDTKVEETYLDKKEKPEKVLNLSEHPENLNILAQQISEIIHNPELPESVRECLENELCETTHLDLYTPENVLANLRSKQ